MKFIVLLQLAVASLSYGYVVSDCGGAEIGNFASDGKCSGIPAEASVQYQSDIGCVLSTYSDAGCTSNKAVTGSQNACFAPGYTILGVICA